LGSHLPVLLLVLVDAAIKLLVFGAQPGATCEIDNGQSKTRPLRLPIHAFRL
jgi:hypothetical protein